jgi:hypothetical protein
MVRSNSDYRTDLPLPTRAPLPKWTEALTRLLDDAFEIPGTRVRVGMDAILGLIAPGAGDALTSIVTAMLILEGFKQRVPTVILLRMLLNVTLDAVIGSIPVIGDLFDVVHRAARKNLELLQRHGGTAPLTPRPIDYVVVGVALLCVLALLALPVVIGLGLIHLVATLAE